MYNIAMVTDFFYPQPGGVEFHVYHLSQQLINLGHSVVVITHDYGTRNGVRVLSNGLKVYYVPYFVVHRSSTFPSVFLSFPFVRNILLREDIDIVHGHGSFSTFSCEAILHARTMGYRTVFTDHSLIGFADVASIMGNKLLKFTLSDVGHVICVSHTCKENTVLRASLDPLNVSVIPNAVISRDFRPGKRSKEREGEREETEKEPLIDKPTLSDGSRPVTVVVISRLFPNKGADLLVAIVPRICMAHPEVRFLIAGDGPKFLDLEQMREKHYLQDRVQLIGGVSHEDVPKVMVQGDIFLHPTLTEAFGTVIVEAASCGLFVVTTRVGGIPEVLPDYMYELAEPEEDSLVGATIRAIERMESGEIDTSGFHDEVACMYSWTDIARRTQNVYDSLDLEVLNESLFVRLQKYYFCGFMAGKLFVLCCIVDIFVYVFLEWMYPRENIDKAEKWSRKVREDEDEQEYECEDEQEYEDHENEENELIEHIEERGIYRAREHE